MTENDAVPSLPQIPQPAHAIPWQVEENDPKNEAAFRAGERAPSNWVIFSESRPDVSGKTGTGIVTYSKDMFIYISGNEKDIQYAVHCANTYPLLLAERDAMALVVAAAKKRAEWGHDDLCSDMLDSEGEPSNLRKPEEFVPAGPCDCGHKELLAALAALSPKDGEGK